MRLAGTKLAANHQYRGFGDQLYDLSGQRPSLDLNFSSSKSLVDSASGQKLVTFTRASSGTYVGSDGLIKTATTNLLLQSEDFSANWTRAGIFAFGSGSVVDALSAPNGSTAADLITEDTSTGRHRLSQGINFVAGVTYTFSIYAKSSTRNIYINFNTAFNASAGFNLSDGSYQINSGSVSVANAGNGWYRVSVTGTATATSTTSGFVQIQTGLVDASYTGDGTSGIYLWGAQLEQSSTVGEYIPTTSTINSAPRFDHNPTTGESLGLLVEEQRTNLLLQSEVFGTTWSVAGTASITADQAAAPNGTTTADRITVTSSGPNRVLQAGVSATSTTYTFSVYTKSDDINGICIRAFFSGGTSIDTYSNFVFGSKTFSDTGGSGTFAFQELQNGWFRLSVTIASGNNTAWEFRIGGLIATAQTGTKAFLWGAQLEAGAFATSYIPTTTAAVTRSADVASISGSNFSGWFNGNEGTMYGAGFVQPTGSASFSRLFAAVGSNAGTDEISMYTRVNVDPATNGRIYGAVTVSSVLTGDVQPPNGSTAGNYVSAFAYRNNDFALSNNGTAPSTDTSGSLPACERLLLYGSARFQSMPVGYIKRFTYWPRRLSDSTLQEITR